MPVNRYYSSTAVDTTLAVGISATATTMVVSSTTGFPTSYPYTLAVDYDTSSEELVNIVGASGTTLTIGTTVGVADISGRGVDQGSTYRQAHSAGAAVKHVISGRDVREPQEHIAATTNVHGIADTSTLITASSTTTMTNKSLTAPVITGTADVTAGTLAFGTGGSITANGATISATELSYVDGATSNLQTQIGNINSTKAPIDSPTFTGTVTIPSGGSITSPSISGGTVSGATLSGSTLSGTTTATSGTIALGTNANAITANGLTISGTEVSRLYGVSSNIQNQLTALSTNKFTTPTGWSVFYPTLSGTGVNNANIAMEMDYITIGQAVIFTITATLSGTCFATSGTTTISLPHTAYESTATVVAVDAGIGTKMGNARIIGSGLTIKFPDTTAGGYDRSLSNTIPFTWVSGDSFTIQGMYWY